MSDFSLEGKALKLTSAEDIIPHIKPLTSSPTTFTTLNLQGNTLGVPASETLAKTLASCTSLTSANLADIFTSRLLSEIPPALDALLNACLALQKLSTIDLSDNAFGLNTAAPLVSFLHKHLPLQNLILNNNGLGPEAGTLVANALTELASTQNPGTLETMVCGRNRLENGSMAAWAKALAAHGGALRSVKMTQNGIRPEGIALLVTEGLARAPKLEVVDLQDNTFTAAGSRALAQVVSGWSELKELGVGECLLRAKGAGMVFDALAAGKNKKLEVLKLSYNEIDSKGVGKLVAAIESGGLPALRRVELNGNKFDEEDENIVKLGEILSERREKAGADEDSEDWGLDELDDLEEPSDDEDEEDEDIAKDADEEEDQNVAQEKDDDVDALADRLGKTGI